MKDHVADKLDSSIFPYVKDSPGAERGARSPPVQQPATSLRSAKPSWHRAARPGGSNELRSRVIVFVAGGVTYSETRTAYQLSAPLKRDIYIGKIIVK